MSSCRRWQWSWSIVLWWFCSRAAALGQPFQRKLPPATIPIVFTTASDPVKLGYVLSLNRPGGNVTGVTFLGAQLVAKRLELAAQLVPKEVVIGFLGRPREPRYAGDRKVIEGAAASLGRKILFLDIADEREFESAFTTAKREHVGVLIPLNDPFFNSHRIALVTLAARYSLPTIYKSREPVADGGLMSYGTSIRGAYRQVGVYAGRILKGEKASDLPVVQSTRLKVGYQFKNGQGAGTYHPKQSVGRR